MEKDFYLHERALASYFEKDWFDHIKQAKFTFAPFDSKILYSDYHEKLIDFLVIELNKIQSHPQSMLEIGSSLGRTYYEVCKKIKSLNEATLVEPSQNMSRYFKKIFDANDIENFAVLKGNVDMDEVPLNTKEIKAACSHVKKNLIESSFQNLNDLKTFDLVICSNVIDQCEEPLKLIELLKKSLNPNGILALSCTYQWQNKYIGNAGHQIKDIHELFDSNWKKLNETNIPFQCRSYERNWLNFLSHVGIFQRSSRN